jgi:hypothetical protein
MSAIIDRRLNDRNKSAVNRERFIRRYKSHVQRAVTDMVADRSIRDMERGGEVKIPVRDIAEPALRHGAGGDREYVHPGNRSFQPGDRIVEVEGKTTRALDIDEWDKCAADPVIPDSAPVFAGLDLASVSDLTALVVVHRDANDAALLAVKEAARAHPGMVSAIHADEHQDLNDWHRAAGLQDQTSRD